MFVLKAIAVWLLILILAVLNGGLREAVLLPNLGKPLALVASGILLSGCILLVSFVCVPRLVGGRRDKPLLLGLLWLVLTLIFEFSFGLLVQGHTWSQLLEAYTFKDGNIWPVVLMVIVLAPTLAVRARGMAGRVRRRAPDRPVNF